MEFSCGPGNKHDASMVNQQIQIIGGSLEWTGLPYDQVLMLEKTPH